MGSWELPAGCLWQGQGAEAGEMGPNGGLGSGGQVSRKPGEGLRDGAGHGGCLHGCAERCCFRRDLANRSVNRGDFPRQLSVVIIR
jgi:hypothetical protein